ncbi:MAG: hypothetical protein KC505_08995 [Myxococcales bacterium]|nr:hypothetical protein [Myxococcales bacterium]USN50111.1 MAG: hypothetical protein H6731_07515 [Myxococcales bacterium]
MNLSIVIAFFMLFVQSSMLMAKFAGIPIRTVTVVPTPQKTYQTPLTALPNRDDRSTCIDDISPEVVFSLMRAERIDEPLQENETYRLNLIAKLFRKMSAVSDSQGARLTDLVDRSRLQWVSKINLSAAIILGQVDANIAMSNSDIEQLKKIADESYRLTSDIYFDLNNSFDEMYREAPRYLLDDIRDIQNRFSRSRDQSSSSDRYDDRQRSSSDRHFRYRRE